MIDLKKISLTVGIAVIFAFFIYYAIEAVYPEPKYEDFCKTQGPYSAPAPIYKGGVMTQPNCTDLPNINNISRACYDKGGFIENDYDSNGCPTNARCNACSKDLDDARKPYAMNMFYITAPIGVAAIVAGMYLPLTVEAIAGGFMFGGVATLFQSTVRVFGDLGKWARVIVLFIELCMVVWVGLKKVSEWKPKKRK